MQVELLQRDDEGEGYHAIPQEATFSSEADCRIVCIHSPLSTAVLRLHISDLLNVAEKFNAVSKCRSDFSPFNRAD
jgi:hypothetical protein